VSFLISDIANCLIAGILLGGLYSIFGLGLNIVSNVLETADLSLAFYLLLGAWFQYLLYTSGLNILVSTILAPLMVFGLSFVFCIPLRKVKSHADFLVVTMGYAFILQDIISMTMTTYPRGLPYMDVTISVGEIQTTLLRLLLFAVSVASIMLLWFVMNKTHFGKQIRAYAQDAQVAYVLGVNGDRLATVTQMISAMLSAFAGALIIILSPVSMEEVWIWFFRGFTILALGGVGSIAGSLAAGTIIGVVESLSRLFLASHVRATSFYFLLIILLVKPNGLFGRKVLA